MTLRPVKKFFKKKFIEQFRGFVFLTFGSSNSIEKILKKKVHKVKGRKVDVKKAMSKKNGQKPKNCQNDQERKIFLFKLKKSLKKSKKFFF